MVLRLSLTYGYYVSCVLTPHDCTSEPNLGRKLLVGDYTDGAVTYDHAVYVLT